MAIATATIALTALTASIAAPKGGSPVCPLTHEGPCATGRIRRWGNALLSGLGF